MERFSLPIAWPPHCSCNREKVVLAFRGCLGVTRRQCSIGPLLAIPKQMLPFTMLSAISKATGRLDSQP